MYSLESKRTINCKQFSSSKFRSLLVTLKQNLPKILEVLKCSIVAWIIKELVSFTVTTDNKKFWNILKNGVCKSGTSFANGNNEFKRQWEA